MTERTCSYCGATGGRGGGPEMVEGDLLPAAGGWGWRCQDADECESHQEASPGGRVKYVHGQIITFALQALYRHAEIVSGGYKLRGMQQGVEDGDIEKYRELGLLVEKSDPDYVAGSFMFRRLTDDEKLKDSMATMQRHIHLVTDCIEFLGKEEE